MFLFFAGRPASFALLLSGAEGGGGGAGWFDLEKIHLLRQEDGASRHREGAPLTECQRYFFGRVMSKPLEGFGSDMKHHVCCLLQAGLRRCCC